MSKICTGIDTAHYKDGGIQCHDCTHLHSVRDSQSPVTCLSKWDTNISRELDIQTKPSLTKTYLVDALSFTIIHNRHLRRKGQNLKLEAKSKVEY